MKCTCNICEVQGEFVESTDVVCLTCYYKAQAKAELFDEMETLLYDIIGWDGIMHHSRIRISKTLTKAKELNNV